MYLMMNVKKEEPLCLTFNDPAIGILLPRFDNSNIRIYLKTVLEELIFIHVLVILPN